MKKYVISGGPGVGKTTIINLLKNAGFNVVNEVARPIIEEEQEKEKTILNYSGIFPWNELEKFQDLVIEKQLHKESLINSSVVFLDRSLVDPVGYCKQGKVNIRSDIFKLIKDAGYFKIFYLDNLSNYFKDNERLEDEVKAKKLHELIYEAYNSLGFNIVNVPELTPEERLKFILKIVENQEN